jgi:invasion protein IalB
MTKTAMALYAAGLFILGAGAGGGGDHLLFPHKDQRDGMETVAALQDWRLTCPPRTTKDGSCLIQSTIVQKGTNNPVAEITVAPKNNADLMTVVVPLGVFVPTGIKFGIGAISKTIPFKTCLQVGCIATAPVDSALASAFASNATGSIGVVGADGRSIPLNFSMHGYGDALADRSADMAARK